MGFNLLTEGFIPILRTNGRTGRLGIKAALLEAGGIREIAAPNPMDRVAILRFLLAVLYWCKGGPPTPAEKNRILANGSLPAEWLARLDREADCFNLLGDGKRFLQNQAIWGDAATRSEKEAQKGSESKGAAGKGKKVRDGISFRPVGDLMQEFPTDTKIIHFRHVQDGRYGFCPACCAVGLIRFCAFASAYAQVFPAGINGPTPAYATPTGPTLLTTLLMNWVASTVDNDAPGWASCGKTPPDKNAVGIMAAFTWRPRRIWLGELSKELAACACCGKKGDVIARVAFGPGWKSPFTPGGKDKKFWRNDPHLLLAAPRRNVKQKQKRSRAKAEEAVGATQGDGGKTDVGQPIGFPSPSLPVGIHARFWRTALRTAMDDTTRRDLANAVQVLGPAANKALYQDAAALQLPSVADADRIHASKWLDTVGKFSESLLAVLRRATPNPDRQQPNRKSALEAATASLEAKLRVLSSGLPASIGQDADSTRTLADEFARVVRQVVKSTTSGSPFRRRQAHRLAESLLREAFEKIRAEEP